MMIGSGCAIWELELMSLCTFALVEDEDEVPEA
jgi:hypothetical protein